MDSVGWDHVWVVIGDGLMLMLIEMKEGGA